MTSGEEGKGDRINEDEACGNGLRFSGGLMLAGSRFVPAATSYAPYFLLAEGVLLLHLLWCAWVLLGWTVTQRRPLLRTFHIASLVYAMVIELIPWPPCPLTAAETWLEARASIEPTHGPFLVRVLDAVVYPDVPEWLIVGSAVLVCAGILGVYLWRYVRRDARGQW